jgi:hypothetical protein
MSVCSATATLAGGERERFHFQTVNFPNDTFTQLLGINDEEMIAGYYDAATNTINGINDRGQIVGFYVAAGGNTDGFVGSK